MVRNYELTFIAKPDMDVTTLAALAEKVKGFITADGGAIVRFDQWGMRRLMYPIGKYKDGQYFYTSAQMDAATTAKLESRLKLTEDVIRYLLVRAEDTGKAAPKGEPAAAASEPAAAATIPMAEPVAAATPVAVATPVVAATEPAEAIIETMPTE